MILYRAHRLATGLTPVALRDPIQTLKHLPASTRTFFFDPIFLPAQEFLISVHAATGIPWYLLISSTGLLHTILFRLPHNLIIARLRPAAVHSSLLMTSVQSALIRAHGNPTVGAICGGITASKVLSKAGIRKLETGPKQHVWAVVSSASWLWCMALMRRINGGVTMWGEHFPIADETLKTGGALWFPDLTVVDPTLILPVSAMGLLTWNWLPKSRAEWMAIVGRDDPERPVLTPVRARVMRVGLVLTPVFWSAIDTLTAGSTLFMLTSFLSRQVMFTMGRRDELMGMKWDEAAKNIAEVKRDGGTLVGTRPGKPVKWWMESK